MSKYLVEIAEVAESDIRDAFFWYHERSALIADAFRAEVLDAIDRVGKAPLGKAADDAGNRRRVLRRFPYSVVYDVQVDTVTIIAVSHHRRKPEYWRKSKT